MTTTKDYLHLHFIVVVWGFTAILGLLVSIPAVEMVFYRTLIAFIVLGILLIFKKHPDLETVKDTLYQKGAVYASMSGSGSAIYGIFEHTPDLPKAFPQEYTLWQSVL